MTIRRPLAILIMAAVFGITIEIFSIYVQFVRAIETVNEATVRRNVEFVRAVDWQEFSEVKKKDLTLMFVGDVMLSREVGKQAVKNGDWRFPFLKVASTTQVADLLFGNLEGPISRQGKNQGSEYSFRSDSEVVKGLQFAGFDIMSVANNHIMDWGREALKDTLLILRSNNIWPVGAGQDEGEANKPIIIEKGANKIAFLGYTNLYPKSFEATTSTAGLSHFDKEKIKQTIAAIRQSADLVVVSLHWGVEYEKKANQSQRDLGRALIDSGADLVIGHHPHVVQEVERYKNGWIVYNLGNFVFDQNFSKETTEGLMITVNLQRGKPVGLVEQKIKISPAYQPEIVEN